jgi:hydroxylamine reductase
MITNNSLKNTEKMSMFCYQCQEAAKGIGCEIKGVCGKTEEVSNLQDLLMFVSKGVSILTNIGRQINITNAKADQFVFEALFTTITNANFDEQAIIAKIKEGFAVRELVKVQLSVSGQAVSADLHESTTWMGTQDEFNAKALEVGVLAEANEDLRSLKELLIYGLKGMAAYAEHAFALGHVNDEVFAFMHKALAASTEERTAEELVGLVLECGKFGVDVMALLDKANTESYGNPEITEVNLGVQGNPGILISGHDLKDMETLLKQTEGTGVDVYTHSEMLPAHYYPAFKRYEHFVGNYGNAWWQQKEEFTSFNGPILFTTNCIVPPSKDATYKDKIYTTGQSGLTGATHIVADENGIKDFTAIIEHAKKCESPIEIETGTIVGGFAHNQVLALADKVVDAVKDGAIKKFFVMAGCDGRMKGRDYYADFAKQLPEDTVILTAGCAKYRYNKLELGNIGGIPRVLDAGQCNDSYSLAVIALKLKEVFELNDINELPIVYNIAWYEQKAVIVLLALLYLGVKDIHLGPTLPAFLSPNVAKVLVDNFGISGITNVKEDMNKFMGVEV